MNNSEYVFKLINMKSRKFVIGDIHGGLKGLKDVLKKADVVKKDEFIFLGDYVDGWGESAELIDFLIKFEKKNNCIFLKGNHDLWLIDWLKNGLKSKSWEVNGGKSTLKSYKNVSDKKKQKHLLFFESMKYYHTDDLNRLFVHAGFTSIHGVEYEYHHENFCWDRTLWETAKCIDKKLSKRSLYFPKRLKLFNEIYIGHSATINYGTTLPMNFFNLWNIDTGAGFNGKLTMLDIDSKKIYQSDFLYKLYPKELGRI